MRDYTQVDRYLNELADDIYPQPPDEPNTGHDKAITHIGDNWLSKISSSSLKSVLDVGCGQGVALHMLSRYAKRVEGVTLGNDADIAGKLGYTVHRSDMSFLPYNDKEFNLIFSRHSIEHSPMPLLTLMEWYRVSSQWLMMIVPDVEHYAPYGLNHYSVLTIDQWKTLLDRAGWHVIWIDRYEPIWEIRFFCEKKVRKNLCLDE